MSDHSLYYAVHQLLRDWMDPNKAVDPTLTDLFAVRADNSWSNIAEQPRIVNRIVRMFIEKCIDQLNEYQLKQATLIRERFLNDKSAKEISAEQNETVDKINRLQRTAINALCYEIETSDQSVFGQSLYNWQSQLPSTENSKLFGVENVKSEIVHNLQERDSNRIHVIHGIGGIGKTSLTGAVARALFETRAYVYFAFVKHTPTAIKIESQDEGSVFAQLLTGIAAKIEGIEVSQSVSQMEQEVRRYLGRKKSLLVIDNIESEQIIEFLVAKFTPWAREIDIIITSRARPSDISGNFFSYGLNQLSEQDAFALIRYEAGAQGLDELAQKDDAELQKIYDIAGGNPLALKLAVGLALTLPFDEIIADLQKARSDQADGLYRHIYGRVWESLSAEAQELLLSAFLTGKISGGSSEQLMRGSGLSKKLFVDTIMQLAQRNLIEVRSGSVGNGRYGIHRLTESFLKSDVIPKG